MTTPEDIHWGAYQEYEGPFYKGKIPYQIPEKPQDFDKLIAVITATEGGRYDAINMYDRMILSVGLIQWGEAGIFAVSNLLGEVCNQLSPDVVLQPLQTVLNIQDVEFKKNPKGQWRFFLKGKEVTTITEQQQLFLGCDGHKGNWTPTAKAHAKSWAAAVANVWVNPKAQEIQRRYTANKVLGFAMKESKALLFNDTLPSTSWIGAMRAIYLSFAANLPKTANDMLISTKFIGEKWSEEWCISLIKQLTLGPKIGIYPRRYDAIRPVVEKLYGINLPKTVKDLESWSAPEPKDAIKNDQKNEITTTQSTMKQEAIVTHSTIAETSANTKNGVLSIFKFLFELFFKIFKR
jgi:hypothetical protein